jgi:hypothetical protein
MALDPNERLNNYLDEAAAAIDSVEITGTMTASELASKARAAVKDPEFARQFDQSYDNNTTGQQWASDLVAFDSLIAQQQQQVDKGAKEEVSLLQEKVWLLETKLAAVWDLLKLTADSSPSADSDADVEPFET